MPMDKIFRALSDPSRRKILDIVKNNPGINVNDITEFFDFSRYAVMKHLKILEDTELIISQRSGKFKKLYINVMPIQLIYDRWISQYSEMWAKNLSSLKHSLEQEDFTMSQTNPRHVFVVYIKSTKEKVWEALTNPEKT
ncbi:MAG: helix-turn-helix domain-containing protein, partial [Aliifodinibius sp.]|nr:helix-turn-helix domain-containing protein [Fodinibius sp.]